MFFEGLEVGFRSQFVPWRTCVTSMSDMRVNFDNSAAPLVFAEHHFGIEPDEARLAPGLFQDGFRFVGIRFEQVGGGTHSHPDILILQQRK
jgi:hypothetical protein